MLLFRVSWFWCYMLALSFTNEETKIHVEIDITLCFGGGSHNVSAETYIMGIFWAVDIMLS